MDEKTDQSWIGKNLFAAEKSPSCCFLQQKLAQYFPDEQIAEVEQHGANQTVTQNHLILQEDLGLADETGRTNARISSSSSFFERQQHPVRTPLLRVFQNQKHAVMLDNRSA